MQTATAGRSLAVARRAEFDGFFASLGQGFNAYLERLARTDEVNRLNAMTDAELAGLGIGREDIVRYAFRDRLAF